MEAKEIWDQACKQTLEAIAKAFKNNLDRATSIDIKATFSAVAKEIEKFPLPEFQHPPPVSTIGGEKMKIEEFIGERATYDQFGQKIYGVKGKGKNEIFQMIADVRGWGAIQNLFLDEKDRLDEKAAGKFQDDLGQWIADAISEKLQRNQPESVEYQYEMFFKSEPAEPKIDGWYPIHTSNLPSSQIDKLIEMGIVRKTIKVKS